MKIAWTVFIACIVGCADIRRESEIIQAKHAMQVREISGGDLYNWNSSVCRLQVDEHKYILFRESANIAIVHDPDCKCVSVIEKND